MHHYNKYQAILIKILRLRIANVYKINSPINHLDTSISIVINSANGFLWGISNLYKTKVF